MIVIFEGPDGAGKTVLLRAFNSATHYAHIAIDRLHLSHMVFAQMFGRKEYTDDATRRKAEIAIKDFMRVNNVLIVYVKADVSELRERIRQRGEDPEAGPDVTITMALYEHWIEYLGLEKQVLTVDTTNLPGFNVLIAQITKKIKSMERRK